LLQSFSYACGLDKNVFDFGYSAVSGMKALPVTFAEQRV